MAVSVKADKKPTIHWVFFWFLGIASLFVWNCMLTLTDYYSKRIHPNVENYDGFFFNVGGFIAFLLMDSIGKYISFKTLLMSVPCFQVAVFVGIYILCEFMGGEQSSPLKQTIFFILITFAGFSNCNMQTNAIRYAFKFTHVEVSVYNAGSGVAGMLTSTIALALAYFEDQSKVSRNGLVYLVFLAISLVFIMIVFMRYFAAGLEGKDDSPPISADSDKQKDVGPRLLDTYKQMNPFLCNMILVYSITLGVYPAFNFSMGLGWDHPAAAQYILLTYNVGDFLGKIIYAKFPLKDNWLPHCISLARVIFIGYILYVFGREASPSYLLNDPYITIGFTAVLSLTNGYITSSLFSLSSSRVSSKHQSNSGFLMTASLYLGLAYGGMAVALGKKKD